MVTDDSYETTDKILKYVEEWKNDSVSFQTQFGDATDYERTALLKVDSIASYVTATDYPWYCATIVDL
jgi:hypothetical protein